MENEIQLCLKIYTSGILKVQSCTKPVNKNCQRRTVGTKSKRVLANPQSTIHNSDEELSDDEQQNNADKTTAENKVNFYLSYNKVLALFAVQHKKIYRIFLTKRNNFIH